ncbi:transporter substrate-binding domain-containing protein [Blastopirellula sp. JC732]|uniref:Transporter substrate-binding domain-containing protein n=1 Tax=Blastopirellula sediminis TaxID=2894196 RepID=A0A9X1MGV5_9BACT|nr:transporter substrate-binding domain-containing protein [Blastopirellula sediminis]MCC9604303.1 transporter substrate-binding domain-containing protein [Blastopirellula sediminis]MCC9626823.1 transporter substrate-binding domain-containing protein [Blastopirellula sediminis]
MKTFFASKMLCIGLVVTMLSVGCSPAEKPTEPKTLTVAISPDIPPYVLDKATSGLEVDLMKIAFSEYELSFVQLPYEELEKAVPEKKAEVSAGVRQEHENQFDSNDFIGFSNVAIAKKSANIKIEKIADLAPYEVLTWQNAYLDLGGEFEKMYAPAGPDRAKYKEVADQKIQVEDFWKSDNAVIVIDQNIFNHFSESLGHSLDDVQVFDLFPAVTNFKVAFADEKLCIEFNNRIRQLCKNGEYQKLLDKYQVQLPETPCDEAKGEN